MVTVKISRVELFNAMVKRSKVMVKNHQGRLIRGVINSIQMEDGSGYSFNVTICKDDCSNEVVYMRVKS